MFGYDNNIHLYFNGTLDKANFYEKLSDFFSLNAKGFQTRLAKLNSLPFIYATCHSKSQLSKMIRDPLAGRDIQIFNSIQFE